MMIKKITIATIATIAMFVASCGNNKSHNENDGHDHASETVQGAKDAKKASRNEKGQLVDAAGHLITGCPGHKEMIGSQGDMCPLCEYMVMIPITWNIDGVDTVRVTSLSDYNPPADKSKTGI